ncbi:MULTISPECIES: GFA family protein [unclassified Sinorhizobium]|uniref:GFA family protein n=1 Tax=unclassified Sinorhizobium TaxID=2613772 RepID=UPI0035239C85
MPPGGKEQTERTGGCLCGEVRYRVDGKPLRIGLCHCADCRKTSGSAFVTFAVWPRQAFAFSGDIATFQGRSFCPRCGSRLFCLGEEETEIRVGSLDDAPTDLSPTYEIWVKRREPWLAPLPGRAQYDEDAPTG